MKVFLFIIRNFELITPLRFKVMKYINFFTLLFFQFLFSQNDFTENWEDLYSYNNVQDFIIDDSKIYAACENAIFIYDIDTNETQKFSSVNGLSGNTISSISYDDVSESIMIGYENGLIEIIQNNSSVIPITGIRDNVILIDKAVKGFYRNQDQTYIFGEFGVLVIDLNELEFGDSYKLSFDTSTSLTVNQMLIKNNILYTATSNGFYGVDLSLDLSNFSNWNQIVNGQVTNVVDGLDEIYFSRGSNVYKSSNPTQSVLSVIGNVSSINIDSSNENHIVVTTPSKISVYDLISSTVIEEIDLNLANNYNINTTKSIIIDNNVFLNTFSSGVLTTSLSDKVNYIELHPEGPSENNSFSISLGESQKWIVYGGYTLFFDAIENAANVDYFYEGKWNYLDYREFGSTTDCIATIIDPLDNTKVLVASVNKGIVELNDFEYLTTWTKDNTNSILPGHRSVGGGWTTNMVVDNNNNIWTANSRAGNNLFFSKYNGRLEGENRWEANVDFSGVLSPNEFVRGFNKMFVDHNNNIFVGTPEEGLFVFNANDIANESDRNVAVLNNIDGNGQLSSLSVKSVVSDENNRVWIGTNSGLVVYDDYENLFVEGAKTNVKTIVFEENGEAKELLGDTQVNDIIIDLAGNKWFGTSNAGLFQTSSDGQTTYNTFTNTNSPLPSNTILDLELDKQTGEIYIVTEKGILIYDGKNEPFGENITEVIAYPNPAIKNQAGHDNITIVAKDGNGIPDGTNVKIMDVSGKLVYETNINSFDGNLGGKIVWNKRNLRGNSVVSGVYIVLLSNSDATETTTTKIAIVN